MNKIFNFLLIISLATTAVSCKKSDPQLPDNTISFAVDQQGLETTATEAEVKINLSRTTDVAIPVTVTLTNNGLSYGVEYTTDPAATNNTITLNIPAGGSGISFKVKKTANAVLNGNESIDMNITSAGKPVVLGTTLKSKLSFSAITSDGSQLTLKGIAGTELGSSALNSVFVDLSSNTQTGVKRNSWVLGFSSAADFRVKLNSTNGTSAIKLAGKTDLNAVTTSDVKLEDLGIQLGVTEAPGVNPFINIDNVYGDITKDVIANVSATDAENPVYVVNPEGGSHSSVLSLDNLIKIRVLRKGSGYTLQYAKLKDATFKTLDITKDASNNFVHLAIADVATVVNVEPAKAKWDFVWTWSVYYGMQGPAAFPYGFSDLVFVNNLGGVQAALVSTATVSYADYKDTNIASTNFKAERNVIGSEWRSVTPATGVKTDRFYVIKDGSGNVYKLRFVSMGAGDSGKRGEPVIEYKLVKKG